MNLVLDEEVDQGHQGTKETASKEFAVSNGFRIVPAESKTSQRPREGGHEIGNHENIMPIVVVGRCHICPSTTCHRSEYAGPKNELRQRGFGARSHGIP